MSSETKRTNRSNIGGGFRSRMEHYLYSGDKKHVMAGIGIISLIFGIPWYLMSRGTKHQSHQDYLEKADKSTKCKTLIKFILC
ncbi:GAG1At protein [Quillaja saponaria]|uniref:GAG1At protein n=1 Tax=Quillaja saponaria TaxID=32244 RepID=A0AAD7L5J9_QUISA|nr:GAG1At protein [Quillaja saponaria]